MQNYKYLTKQVTQWYDATDGDKPPIDRNRLGPFMVGYLWMLFKYEQVEQLDGTFLPMSEYRPKDIKDREMVHLITRCLQADLSTRAWKRPIYFKQEHERGKLFYIYTQLPDKWKYKKEEHWDKLKWVDHLESLEIRYELQ